MRNEYLIEKLLLEKFGVLAYYGTPEYGEDYDSMSHQLLAEAYGWA